MAQASGALSANDKVVLLLSLVPFLIERGDATVAEAAARFRVDETQIRSAFELIGVSGLPGETGTYQHNDLFDIDWDALEDDRLVLINRVAIEDSPRLSSREAAALIAGLQYLSALPGNVDNDVLDGLLAKLARGASGDPTAVAVGAVVVDQSLSMLRDAIDRGVEVEFDYMGVRGERERRTVDPVRLDSRDDDWYLKGWCHLREAVRTFRVDRVTGLTITDRAVTPRDVEVPETMFQPSSDDQFVEARVAEDAVGLLGDVVAERSPNGTARLRAAHFNGVKRLAAANAGLVEITAPAEARDAVRDWATAALERYRH